MILLTKEIQQSLPTLYETEKVPSEDKIIVVKFFNPVGNGTWYIAEGSAVCLDGNSDDYVYISLKRFKITIDQLNVEYELSDGSIVTVEDVEFFGLCDLGFPEWGPVVLSELKSGPIRFGLGIERDKFWKPRKLDEARYA